jgi:hypothetical protein
MNYSYLNHLKTAWIGLAFLLCLLILIYTFSEIPIFFILSLFIFKIFFLLSLYLANKSKTSYGEPIFLLALLDAVFFGITYFILYFFFPHAAGMSKSYYQPENIIYSTSINTLGWSCFVLGYFIRMSYKTRYPLFINKNIFKRLRRSLAVGVDYPLSNIKKIYFMVVCWLGISFLLNFVLFLSRGTLRGSQNLPTNIAFLLSLLGYSDILFVSFLTVFTAKTTFFLKHRIKILYLVIVVAVLTLGKSLINTSKEEIIIPIVIAILTWFLSTRQIPRLILITGLLFYLVFAPINAYLRNDFQSVSVQPIQFQNYVDIASNLINSLATNGEFLTNTLAATIGRLDLLGISSTLINGVDKGFISNTNGASFLTFVYAFIPRIIFPSKPINTELYNPNYLGRITGVIASNDFDTSIAFGASAELYLNLKIPGVILGMFALGYMFKSFYELIVQTSEPSDLAIITLSFPLYSFLRSYTSSFSAIAGIIPSTIFSLILISLFSYLIPTYKTSENQE